MNISSFIRFIYRFVVILYVIDIVLENKLSKPDYSTFFSGNDYLTIKFSYFDNIPLYKNLINYCFIIYKNSILFFIQLCYVFK